MAFLRLEAEIAVQRAHQPAHGHQRRSDQHRADGNLHHQQHVAERNPPPGLPAMMPLDPALTTSYGLVRSTCRTGTAPKRNPLTSANSNATTYTFASGLHGHDAWEIGELAATRSAARNSATLPSSPSAPPASEISTASVNSSAQNALAARSQREPQSNFAGAVGGARGKQAAQVGARGQQNQSRPAASIPS